jgi:hypothetical protein
MRRQFREEGQTFLIATLVLIGVLSFMYLLIYQWRDSFTGGRQNGIFLIGLFAAGAFVSNYMFRDLSDKSKGIWILTIPATHAEKIIVAVVVSCFIFLAFFIGIFSILDGVYATLTKETRLDLFKNNFYLFFFTYFIFNGVFMLGSIVFNRNSFIKTLLFIILFSIIYNYANLFLITAITGIDTIESATPMDSFIFSHENENIYVTLPAAWNTFFEILNKVILPLSLWVICWLKLKEKEI